MNKRCVSEGIINMIQIIQIRVNSVKAYISVLFFFTFTPLETGGEY